MRAKTHLTFTGSFGKGFANTLSQGFKGIKLGVLFNKLYAWLFFRLVEKVLLVVFAFFVLGGGCNGSSSEEEIAEDSTPQSTVAIPVATPQTVTPATPFPDAQQDRSWSYFPSLALSGGTLTLSGAPAWLGINSSTGELSGIPTVPASFSGIEIVLQKNAQVQRFGPFSLSVLGDPLKSYAWHLNNTGQSSFANQGGTSGVDLHLGQTLAQNVLGQGVRIAVSDTGIEIAHEDLKARILAGESRNYYLSNPWTGDPTPSNLSSASAAHGTAVAGIIAATGWNSKGSRGVAPLANLAGFLFLGPSQTGATYVNQATGDFDIFNYSYGTATCYVNPPYGPMRSQVEYAVSNGRSGKGSLYVKSAGNEYIGNLGACDNELTGYGFLGNSNFDGTNTIPELIVVGALNAEGVSSSYSSPGSNLWISAPGGEYGAVDPAIITTDLSGCTWGFSRTNSTTNSFENGSPLNPLCSYTSAMNGTSSAAPMVSGVIALMLTANPELTWRDVKYILAKTAKKVQAQAGASAHPAGSGYELVGHVYQQGWTENAAGISFHNWYGFGAVDAEAAVAMAQNYSYPLGTLVKTGSEDFISGAINLSIPDGSAGGVSSVIPVSQSLQIEAVEVTITLVHAKTSEIGIELTSPAGTKSILTNINSFMLQVNFSDSRFLSNAYLDENSLGSWSIKVLDGYAGTTGTLANWKLRFYGH